MPSILYKYLPLERFDFFESPKLRFTPYKELNDPFESKVTFLSCPVSEDRNEAYEAIYSSLHPALKTAYTFSDIVKSFQEPLDVLEEEKTREESRYIEKIKHFGILSLSEEKDNILLWSHYASNHCGFVIGFDAQSSYFNNPEDRNSVFGNIRRVSYSQERINLERCSREDCHPLRYCPLDEPSQFVCLREKFSEFFLKSSLWSYEKEWRVLTDNVININEFSGFIEKYIGIKAISVKSIKAIYLGLNVEDRNKQIVLDFCRKNEKISIYQARQHETRFEIKFEEIM